MAEAKAVEEKKEDVAKSEHVITFQKPYSFEGKEYTEVDLNLDSLTGKDFNDVTRQLKTSGWFAPIPATDPEFCMHIAARGSKLPLEFFESMPAGLYGTTVQRVSNFLMSAG